MKKNIIYLLFALLISSCSESIPEEIKYTIISEEINENINRCGINVQINKITTEEILTVIASEIRKSRKTYTKLLIYYHLPDQNPGSGAWAYTNYDPDFEVKILGGSISTEDYLKNIAIDKKEVLGKWIDIGHPMPNVNFIYIENDSVKLLSFYADKSNNLVNLRVEKTNEIFVYENENTKLKINKNGDLEFIGSSGVFSLAKKIH